MFKYLYLKLIIYVGYFYILLGSLFLLIPLLYLEIGRPKDFIKAALKILIGIILIIKKTAFESIPSAICLLLTVLLVFNVVEIFTSRWNQLTDKEKNQLITLVQFKKNLLKMLEAINLGVANLNNSLNFFKFDINNDNKNKKEWVRNDKK